MGGCFSAGPAPKAGQEEISPPAQAAAQDASAAARGPAGKHPPIGRRTHDVQRWWQIPAHPAAALQNTARKTWRSPWKDPRKQPAPATTEPPNPPSKQPAEQHEPS